VQSPCDPAGDHRCAHHDFDYPLEFARSRADLFYALRDARNNLKVVVPSDHVPLSVVADQDSVVHSAGQQMILTIINALLRCGRRFASLSVDIPDAPLCTTVAGIAATTLRGAVLELSQKVRSIRTPELWTARRIMGSQLLLETGDAPRPIECTSVLTTQMSDAPTLSNVVAERGKLS